LDFEFAALAVEFKRYSMGFGVCAGPGVVCAHACLSASGLPVDWKRARANMLRARFSQRGGSDFLDMVYVGLGNLMRPACFVFIAEHLGVFVYLGLVYRFQNSAVVGRDQIIIGATRQSQHAATYHQSHNPLFHKGLSFRFK